MSDQYQDTATEKATFIKKYLRATGLQVVVNELADEPGDIRCVVKYGSNERCQLVVDMRFLLANTVEEIHAHFKHHKLYEKVRPGKKVWITSTGIYWRGEFD